jgi:SAM-dependent methyltransferase
VAGGRRTDEERAPAPDVARFLGEPTRDLGDWRRLWESDLRFPVASRRGPLGRLVVAVKKLFRPLVRAPLGDLWDRQRVFNLILLERLQQIEGRRHEERIGHLEGAFPAAVDDALRHNDALFARVDQKLDRTRRQALDLREALGAALAALSAGASGAAGDGGPPSPPPAPLVRAVDEHLYVELERRFRGTEEEIAERLGGYLPLLRDRGPVLDLGCGRGEMLALLAAAGTEAKGVDGSAGMVVHCRGRGLTVEEGDLFAALAAVEEGSLGAVASFHVVEHLPPESLDPLVRLAWRALRPGGALVLETPNPLSLVVAARNFWLDPTHRRPVHPDALRLCFELAGFDPVERLDLRPFPPAERLPELDLAALPEAQRDLADRINRLRDRLDDLLFGCQDYALVGYKTTS